MDFMATSVEKLHMECISPTEDNKLVSVSSRMSLSPDTSLLSVPKDLSEVTSTWLRQMLLLFRPSADPDEAKALSITTLDSDKSSFKEICRVRLVDSDDKIHAFRIETLPSDPELRQLTLEHKLFAKEVHFHTCILPKLEDFVKKHNKNEYNDALKSPMNSLFSTARLVHGAFEEDKGVLVFEDFEEQGLALEDPVLMINGEEVIFEALVTLAKFHAACLAYNELEEDLDKLFDYEQHGRTDGSAWFEGDLAQALKDMYAVAHAFFKAIPGQERVSAWFESRMCEPTRLQDECRRRPTRLRVITHGDLWHNNLFSDKKLKLVLNDWQMCHVARATNDVCFLLFSSTTPSFRKTHWLHSLRLYFDRLDAELRGFGIRNSVESFESFLADEVAASIPISLFFCGNVRDLDLDTEDEFELDSLDEETCARIHSCLELFVAANTKEDEQHRLEDGLAPLLDYWHRVYTGEDAQGGILMKPIRHNSKDNINDNLNHKGSKGCELNVESKTSNSALSRVPTLVDDKELQELVNSSQTTLDDRKARAVRRRLYLELYVEAANRNLI